MDESAGEVHGVGARDEPEHDGTASAPRAQAGALLARAKGTARSVLRPVAITIARPVVHRLASKPPKKISAMLRVKNEQEFVERAMASVVDLVDELVVIDNASTDATPQIIADFAAARPNVRTFQYPHQLARYGSEHTALAATRAGRRSPAFLATFYNWCVDRCRFPFILKWDGDTVATEALGPVLERFRTSPAQILWHTGINVHESRTHAVAGRPFEDIEPRLFARRFAHYGTSLGYVETLWSPYIAMFPELAEREEEPLYFHLKFCKHDRFTNMSADLVESERRNSAMGEPLSADLLRQVRALQL